MPKAEKSAEVILTPTAATEFARRVASVTTVEEQAALLKWLHQLSEVRAGDLTSAQKAVQALTLTAKSRTLWPVLKTLASLLKQHGWDDRSLKARFGIVGATAGMVVFGWAGAGIAALGGAIGLPLWIVLGAGGLAAGALIEELSAKKRENRDQ